MATISPKLATGILHRKPPSLLPATTNSISFTANSYSYSYTRGSNVKLTCKATEASSGGDGKFNWVTVVPLSALPKGETCNHTRRGNYYSCFGIKMQFLPLKIVPLLKDGCIVCPTTDSAFYLQSGAIKEWYPNNPVLRVLTPALRNLFVYPVKTDDENIYISMRGGKADASAEIVFSGKAQPGVTASDVNVDEVRMIIDEGQEAFGFTGRNELINGKAAVIGFLLLLDFELLTGKGLLKGTGFLDFIYSVSDAFK